MNRRLFMGLLTGLAALPAAVVAAVKSKPPGDLFAVTDTACFSDRDFAVTVVFKRHGNGVIELMDDFEWPHTAVVEHGVEHLERVAIDSVRRYGGVRTIFYPSRLNTDDLPGGVLKQSSDGWKPIKLPRFE